MKYLLFIAVFLAAFITEVSAQSKAVYIRNVPENASLSKPVVQLKWFDKPTLFRNPEVYIYRRAPREFWKKLNSAPLKKGGYKIPSYALTKDSSLIACVDLLNKMPADSIKGFMMLTLLLKSFQSSDFAKYAGMMYEDTTAIPGKMYQYKIVFLEKGKEREFGVSPEILCGKYVPPAPPADLVIKAKKKRTEFKWKIETDRYYAVNIYRTASDSVAEIKITPQPIMVSKRTDGKGGMAYMEALYVDKNLRENITYSYRLTALDFFGTETNFTTPVSAFVADSTAPPAPEYLRFEVDKYKVNLKWDEKPDQDLSGYYIYKGTRSTGPFTRINGQAIIAGQANYQDETTSGNFYYYVTSTDKAGNESPSNRIFVHVHDLVAPASPQNFQVRSDTGRIYLNWLPNNESDLMGYQIYRSVDNEDTSHFVLVNSKPFIDPFFVDSLPKNVKNKFMYRVVAVDSSYNRSKPSKIAGAAMPDITPPEMPLIKNGYMDNKYLKVEWVANEDDDLWGYNLYRSSEEDSSSFQQVNINLLPSHSTHYTDQKTAIGKLYNYYLIAIDSSGNHSLASPVYPVRNTDTSGAAQLRLTSTKGRFIKKNNQIHLQWEVEASDVLGAVVYRKDKGQENLTPLTGMINSREYFDKEVARASTYYYEIRIYSNSGAVVRSEVLKIETEK